MEAEILRILKKLGIRITKSRIQVVTAICQTGGFIPNVETFWLELRAISPISRATVYNTVRLMAQFGILQAEYREYRFISYRFVTDKPGNYVKELRNTMQNSIDTCL